MTFGETPCQRAAVTAKMAVRHLVHYSSLPAMVVENELRRTADIAPLPGQEVFERVALVEGLYVSTVVQEKAGGFEHILFFSKVDGLSDAELMSCRRIRTFNRHDVAESL